MSRIRAQGKETLSASRCPTTISTFRRRDGLGGTKRSLITAAPFEEIRPRSSPPPDVKIRKEQDDKIDDRGYRRSTCALIKIPYREKFLHATSHRRKPTRQLLRMRSRKSGARTAKKTSRAPESSFCASFVVKNVQTQQSNSTIQPPVQNDLITPSFKLHHPFIPMRFFIFCTPIPTSVFFG